MKMNKMLLGVLGAVAMQFSATAQDETLTNKNDMPILPEAGEFAIGFNAVPILNWAGNTFNNTANNQFIGNSKFVSNLGQNVLFGKYMLEDKVAIRGHLRVGINNDVRKNYVFSDVANSPDSLATDIGRFNDQTWVIGAGYEFRRGKGRVQGIFGADVFYMHFRETRSFEYENTYGVLNQAPTTTTNFFSGANSPQGERTVSQNFGATNGFGVRPFAGIEFFFAPKMSIGAEFGWNIMYSITGEGETVTEYFEPSTETIIRDTQITAGRNSLDIDTDNFNGALFLMFYF